MLLGTALGIIAAELIEANDKAMAAAKSVALGGVGAAEAEQSQSTRSAGNLISWYKKTFSEDFRFLAPCFGTLAIVLVVGQVFIACDQSVTFVESLYFAVITSTTIGYGDISPGTQAGKLFGSLYALFGVTAVGNVLSNIASYFVEKKQREAMEKVLRKKVTRADFEAFDVDGDGRIEKTEFALRKLMLMGLIKLDDVEKVEKEFNLMDEDGSGEITFEDLDLYIARQAAEEEEREKGMKMGNREPHGKGRVFAASASTI